MTAVASSGADDPAAMKVAPATSGDKPIAKELGYQTSALTACRLTDGQEG